MGCVLCVGRPVDIDVPALSSPTADPAPRAVVNNLDWGELKSIRLVSSKGGSCDLHAAVWNGEAVAVKIVRGDDAASVNDLLLEANVLSELGAASPHRHIIRLLAQGVRTDARPFIVLELLQATLHDILPRPAPRLLAETPDFDDEVSWCEWRLAKARWPIRRAIACALQLAHALKHLHDDEAIQGHQVLHRDLKPDNVGFLADSGQLVLFDFGLATRCPLAASTPGAATDTEARQLTGQTGSPRYMAPEVALSLPYTGKAEVFSFGTILWQLCSHERPWRGMSLPRFEQHVCRDGYRLPMRRRWPASLRRLLSDCWQQEPASRPSFTEVVQRLEDLLRELSMQSRGSSDDSALVHVELASTSRGS